MNGMKNNRVNPDELDELYEQAGETADRYPEGIRSPRRSIIAMRDFFISESGAVSRVEDVEMLPIERDGEVVAWTLEVAISNPSVPKKLTGAAGYLGLAMQPLSVPDRDGEDAEEREPLTVRFRWEP